MNASSELIDDRGFAHIETTDSGLDDLRTILNTTHTSQPLVALMITVVLPICPPELQNQFEKDDDRRANNTAATASLRQIFTILAHHFPASAAGNDSSAGDPGRFLDLELAGVYSPSDQRERDWEEPRPAFGETADLYEDRYRFSVIDLDPEDVAAFPPLPFVRTFKCSHKHHYSRRWNSRVPALLTAKMVNATAIRWDMATVKYEWGAYYVLDQAYRDDLVETIMPSDGRLPAAALPASVTKFSVSLKAPDCDINQRLPNFLRVSGLSYDALGLAIRHLTRACTHVTIEGPLHVSLLDMLAADVADVAGSMSSAAPVWQNLVELDVFVNTRQPHGRWLGRFDPDATDTDDNPIPPGLDVPLDEISAQQPPGYGATDEELDEAEDYFEDHRDAMLLPEASSAGYMCIVREIPDAQEIDAWFKAFASTCARLTKLETAKLRMQPVGHLGSAEHKVVVGAPGVRFRPEWERCIPGGVDLWRVYLHVNDFQPEEDTMELLRDIGRHRGEGDTRVCRLPWGG